MPSLARNLVPSGRRRRLLLGGLALAVGLAGAVALVWSGAPRGARVALVLPFWVAGLGLFQARDHT